MAYKFAVKTRLFYGMPLAAPLLNASPDVRGRVVVTFNDAELEQAHHVEVHLVTRGTRDVASTDFDQGRPLTLDVGARIITLLTPPRVTPASAEVPNVNFDGTTLLIEKCLIKSRERIALSLLVDGESPRLTCPTSHLINVRMKKFTGTEPPIGPWPGLTTGLGLAALGLNVVGIVMHQVKPSLDQEDWFHDFRLFAAWLIILWLTSALTHFVLRLIAGRRQ
ncbi:hypothetical protein P2Q00_35530 [Streptomyces coacervatus]|uniref:hypothetical protein n=1 Tax=Streptomyces coacervatus TaxID=647381 RepID=UPI0031EE7098|nr:hypothetical protein [Streptomyces coacervatus]